jgi:hypothetical protein
MPYGFYGILRDLIRILINVIRYNLIPLYYIYKVKKKKVHSRGIELETLENLKSMYLNQLSHAGI